MDNRLTRSHSDRMLTGVAGGMAEYFDIDPVIIRLLWVLGALFTGGLLLVVYFVMAIIMPSPPDGEDEYDDEEEYEDEDLDTEDEAESAEEAPDGQEAGEADDKDEDAADEEAEPKTDGGAVVAASATSAATSDAPLAEAPRERRREARRERRNTRRRARRRRAAARRRGQGAFVIGSILIVIGALALVDQFSWLSFWQFWPLILIGIGGALILGRLR